MSSNSRSSGHGPIDPATPTSIGIRGRWVDRRRKPVPIRPALHTPFLDDPAPLPADWCYRCWTAGHDVLCLGLELPMDLRAYVHRAAGPRSRALLASPEALAEWSDGDRAAALALANYLLDCIDSSVLCQAILAHRAGGLWTEVDQTTERIMVLDSGSHV